MSSEEIREKLRKLEESLIEGKISEETYKDLKAKYEAELARLEAAPIEPAPPPPEGLGGLFSRAVDFCSKNPVVFLPPIISGVISVVIFAAVGVSTAGIFTGLGGRLEGAPWEWIVPGGVLRLVALAALAFIVDRLIALIFNGWTIAMVKHGTEKRSIDLSDSFSHTLSRFAPLLGASILVAIITGIGTLLCIIPGIIAGLLLALTLQAVIVDNYGTIDSLSVSYNVTRRSFFEVAIIVIVQFVVSAILGFVPYVGAILTGLAGAFFTVVFTMLYYRSRTAGPSAITV